MWGHLCLGSLLPPMDVEQLGTERVLVGVPDGHALCGKDAIEWPWVTA